jgi:molecular chaperone GrpE
MDEIQKKAEKFEVQYNQLKQEFKDYIETSKKNEKKKRLEIRSDISKRLLVVADSLTRITGSDNNNSCVMVKDYADNIRKNINAVYDQMLSASDLSSIDPISGEKFDEQKHTAIGLEFGAKYPENTVFKVVRKGYMMENNVIRPAEVIISKNPAQQKVTKPGLWDRFVRYLKPEKVRLSEIEHKINELERIQKENMDRIDKMIQDMEFLKKAITEKDELLTNNWK